MIGGVILNEWALPFILLFVIIFAILEKSQLFGEAKEQINAITAFATAILAVAVPSSRQFIGDIMPWLGVGLVTLFVFFVLYSFIVGKDLFEDGKTAWIKYLLIVIVLIFVVGVILQLTGLWAFINSGRSFINGEMVGNILIILVSLVLIGWVVKSSK